MRTYLSLFGMAVMLLSACVSSPSTQQTAEQQPAGQTFMELAKERFSVRRFSPQAVEAEKLQQVLEAGNIAPTAKNLQPQRIYVLQSEEALAKVDALTPCRNGAPVVLLFAYNTAKEWTNPLEEGIHSGVEDVSIVATHCMLEATELGLGSLWVNYFPNTQMEQAFGLPESERSVLIMPIGYKAEDCPMNPTHNERKPLSATVKYL